MHPVDLLQWWNLIFDLPFVAALIPLLMQATGAAHFGHGGHGIHLGHVHGGPAGHHFHIGHHHVEVAAPQAAPAAAAPAHAAAGHPQAGHQAAPHGSQSPSAVSRALSLLGIGKVPIMMVFSSFCFLWGFSGLAANLLLAPVFGLPALFILPSMGIALVSSVVLTGALSQGVAKLMPSVETYTTPREGFLGKTGHALYEIDGRSGAAVVLDNESNRVQIKCRTEDEGTVIPRGHSLSVARYDEQKDMFVVREISLTDQEQAELSAFEKRLKGIDSPGSRPH
jgi:hypothetical protein